MRPHRLLQLLSALAIAWSVGLGATWWLLSRKEGFGQVAIGPWSIQARAGATGIDPYTRAGLSRSGALPLASGEGVTITATVDSAGATLDGRCEYRLDGIAPTARGWTLAAQEEAGPPTPADAPRRATVTSAETVRDQNARLAIAVGRIARAGNWLPLRSEGGFTLVMRLYDTPVSAGNAAVAMQELPRIERVGCI